MFKRRLLSFVFAWKGIKAVIKGEPNATIHLLFAGTTLLMGFYFRLSPEEWRWVFLCIALVLAAETMNTAVESIVDLVSPGQHPLAGKAKDAAAGAVLLLAIGAAVIGLSIFVPYLKDFFLN